MPIYFLLHDATRFHQQLRPALTASWRQRSFEPCRPYCADLILAAQAEIERHHLGREEPFLYRVAEGLPFSRLSWRCLAGELLLYGAAEVPDIQTDAETLSFLLAPDSRADLPRERFAPIQQAHFGARDLVFGGYYRPDAAGWNDRDDVARLALDLASCDPMQWTTDDLPGREAALEADEMEDDLAFVRQCMQVLTELYASAATRGQVVVCEVL